MTERGLLPVSRLRVTTRPGAWFGRVNKSGPYITDGHMLMPTKQVAPEILVSLISRAGWYGDMVSNAKVGQLFRDYKSRSTAQVQVFCSGYVPGHVPRAVFKNAQGEPVFEINARKLRLFIAATDADTFYADNRTPAPGPVLVGYGGKRCVGLIAAIRHRICSRSRGEEE